MYSSFDLSGWAGEIIEEMGISGTTTTGSVVAWLENNVGSLNLVLHEDFLLSGDKIYDPPDMIEMNQMAASIYTQMYECFYLGRAARQAAVLGVTDWIEIEGADQGKIRKVSKTEAAKELRGSANDCNSFLKDLIKNYNNQVAGGFFEPSQIIGGLGCGGRWRYNNDYESYRC